MERVDGASSGAAGSEAGMFCEGASPYHFFLPEIILVLNIVTKLYENMVRCRPLSNLKNSFWY